MSTDPHRTLQVDPSACAEVIDAAFGALRELALADPSDAAPRRLAELNRAHRAVSGSARSAREGSRRTA